MDADGKITGKYFSVQPFRDEQYSFRAGKNEPVDLCAEKLAVI